MENLHHDMPRPAPGRRRGRPKIHRPTHDTGTPELILKRMLGDTAEAIDLCLQREFITPQQHWCGIHLRWLYTLRYGAPGVRAIDPTHLGGYSHSTDDAQWRAEKEAEYGEAVEALYAKKLLRPVMDICIFNQCPSWLYRVRGAAPSTAMAHEAMLLHSGLDLLVTLWKNTHSNPYKYA